MSNIKKVGLGSDHGGFGLKSEISAFLESQGIEVVDYGTKDESSVNYPDYAAKVAKAIINGEIEYGIIFCGTGIGISIAANKFPGIRAALCHDGYTAKMSRMHNNANILAIGGRTTGIEIAKEIVQLWLNTDFEGGRHANRIGVMDEQAKECWQQFLAGEGEK